MFDIVLYEPEIPPNTGNIMRLAANCGARLHLVKPLGFTLSHRQLARAGMDYRELAVVTQHECWADCRDRFAGRRLFAVTTRGTERHDAPHYRHDDVFLFGAESRGLPAGLLESLPAGQRIRLPMIAGSRSLNLANAVAIVAYEAWRQLGFAGATSDTIPPKVTAAP